MCGENSRRVFTALSLRDSFGGRNYKMGPLARMVDLATNLGHLDWLCWLVAFTYLDVLLAVEDGEGLQFAKCKGVNKTLVVDNFFKLLHVF